MLIDALLKVFGGIHARSRFLRPRSTRTPRGSPNRVKNFLTIGRDSDMLVNVENKVLLNPVLERPGKERKMKVTDPLIEEIGGFFYLST